MFPRVLGAAVINGAQGGGHGDIDLQQAFQKPGHDVCFCLTSVVGVVSWD